MNENFRNLLKFRKFFHLTEASCGIILFVKQIICYFQTISGACGFIVNQFDLLQKFRDYLVAEKFVPGDRLPGEMELAERFGVSRGTIREIVIHLSLLGVLERSTKRGTFLRKATCVDVGRTLNFQLKTIGCSFDELKAARLLLEAGQAAQLVRLVTPAGLERLRAINDRLSQCTGSPAEADALDLEFHLALQEVGRNRVIQVLGQVLVLMFDTKYRMKFRNAAAVRHSAGSHARILDALARRDAAELEERIRDHIRPL